MAASPKPLRVGIVGCGFFAANQVRAWVSMPQVAIAALCDRQLDRAERLASALGLDVPRFADAAEMVNQVAPDFLDIITTPETHPALVALSAAKGVPAVVQKPMALRLADAKVMVGAMETAHLPFMVHENARFQAPVLALAEILRSGEIGRPVYARLAFRTAHDIYAGQPYLAAQKRFVLTDVGVHVLDVARFLLGEVERVYCEMQRVRPGIAGEDMATVLLRHVSGALSVVEGSYASPLPEEYFPQTLITVEASEGSVCLEPGYQVAVRNRKGVRRLDATPAAPPWAKPPWHVVQDSVRRTQEHWVQCLRAGTEPQTSGRDNLKTLALVEAAYRSAECTTAVRPTLDA
jgi:D-apiose dehydrogenase